MVRWRQASSLEGELALWGVDRTVGHFGNSNLCGWLRRKRRCQADVSGGRVRPRVARVRRSAGSAPRGGLREHPLGDAPAFGQRLREQRPRRAGQLRGHGPHEEPVQGYVGQGRLPHGTIVEALKKTVPPTYAVGPWFWRT